MNRRILEMTLPVFALSISTGNAAQTPDVANFPNKPVRYIIPFPPGAGSDLTARTVAQKLSEIWKIQVVADNRTGASGAIGVEYTANANPDGYTLFFTAGNSTFAAQSQDLAWALQRANEGYATDYPAVIGSHMTNTDSVDFQDAVASVSLRENERGTQVGSGWDPHWHQPTDVFATFTDKDFLLGLNAAQTTLGAVGRLAGATLEK